LYELRAKGEEGTAALRRKESRVAVKGLNGGGVTLAAPEAML